MRVVYWLGYGIALAAITLSIFGVTRLAGASAFVALGLLMLSAEPPKRRG